MEQCQHTQEQDQLCTITIEYGNSIRSIDIENILSGVRMICQYGLAERTGLKSRDFTNVTHIKSIEKGSIIITLFFDLIQVQVNPVVNIDINLLDIDMDIVDILLFYLSKQVIDDKLKFYIGNIKSSLQHIKCITLKNKRGRSVITTDDDGEINVLSSNSEQD